MMQCDEHMMIQLLDHFRERIAKSDKVDHITILVELSGNLGFESIVVAMQTFADITGEGDKVRRREYELLFVQKNSKLLFFGHRFNSCC
jgi:hypothetical protein